MQATLWQDRNEDLHRHSTRYFRLSRADDGTLLATSPSKEVADRLARAFGLPIVVTPPGKRRPRRRGTVVG